MSVKKIHFLRSQIAREEAKPKPNFKRLNFLFDKLKEFEGYLSYCYTKTIEPIGV